MSSITVVTTCRGRLKHLVRTLPKYAGQVPTVLVDYGCPDKTAEWAAAAPYGGLTVVRRPATAWHPSAARNDGLSLVRTPFVAFVDADTIVEGSFADLDPDPGAYYVAHYDGPVPAQPELCGVDWFRPSGGDDLCGFVLCPTAAARRVGGYDEDFVGWGGEDTDFRTRLAFDAGLAHGRLPRGFLSFIPHDHSLRHGVPAADAERVHRERLEMTNAQYRRRHARRTPFTPAEARCPLSPTRESQ